MDPYRLKAPKSYGDPREEALDAIEERIRARQTAAHPAGASQEPEEDDAYLPMDNTFAWLEVARELDVTRYQLEEIVEAAGTRHIEKIRRYLWGERELGIRSRW